VSTLIHTLRAELLESRTMKQEYPAISIPAGEAGKRFTLMVEQVHDYAIFQMDTKGTILTWNTAAETMKLYSAHDAIGSFFGMLYTEEDCKRQHPEHNLRKAAENGTYQEETWRMKKDGSLFWAMVEIIAIKQDEELIGFCKITRDMTVQKMLQDDLAAKKERAQVTLSAIGDAVVAIDADGKIEYLNPKAEHLTGWLNTDAQGRAFAEVFQLANESTLHPLQHQLVSWLKEGQVTAVNSPAVLVSKDGTRYAIEDTAAPIRLPDGHVIGGVVVFRDVTEARLLLNTVTYQATHDALTGLVNRTEFEKRLQRSLARTQQSHVAGVVLYMDLDQFKVVNDTCGHDAGDKLLTQLANLYRTELRDRDTLARLGGDEFALIADHCSAEEAYAIADKILQSTRDFQFVCNDRVFKVGVSIGLVMFDESSHSTQELLQRADQACYVAKNCGRNQIYSESLGKAVAAQHKVDTDWVSRLTQAMRLNQLTLYYQPIATANGDGGGLHYEVLLRLADPENGIIMPGRFLPVAERYELTPTIDRWVVQRVLQWLHENHEHAEQLELCAINLSAKTLEDRSFPGYVAELFKQHNVTPEKLCFEIAETAAIIDMQKSLILINGLRAMGCKVSLGGFGTGMASFAYLKQLPVDFVKIAGSFVSAITQSIVDERMVKSVNDIAHLMGKRTIAECVENQATVEALSRIGIDYLQGNWIAYPKELEWQL
jgi:diguanylate cyclase (GGDEF)-like protein/PAS domain S-box-containing protein